MANKITVYHGSPKMIEKPVFGAGNPQNDYGLGFYCTESLELAKEWACSVETDGFANQYTLDLKDLSVLSRPEFNKILDAEFKKRGWLCQPQVFDNDDDAYARFDFMKDRIGVEVQFGHSSFIGIDLLKFQVASFSNLDTIDFGVYITTTAAFQKELKSKYGLKWEGSLTFEKVVRYLPYIRSAIQVPIYVIGIDV